MNSAQAFHKHKQANQYSFKQNLEIRADSHGVMLSFYISVLIYTPEGNADFNMELR
jgi:hypothetical protein